MRGAISHLQIIHDHRRRFLQNRGKRTSITVNNKYNTGVDTIQLLLKMAFEKDMIFGE